MIIKDQISTSKHQWYAVMCKYRCEKRLMQEMAKDGIEAYVPIYGSLKQYASRKKYSEKALIPSHIFVKIVRSDYLNIIKRQHVYRFLNFSGIISSIPEHEIDLLKRVVGEKTEVRLVDVDYGIGDEVEIIGGDLTGLRGTLVEENNHNFKIALSTLGMGLMIFVDPNNLIKVGSQSMVA